MWAAYGKHPAIKDYFRVGQDFPLLRVFSGWVENGYKQYSKSNGNAMHNAWHFWARGASGKSIVCGLVRDSSDGIGRNYPLLIIGAGPLSQWEENWDLLPLACEAVWRDIERLSVQDFTDLKKLEAEIMSLRQPQFQWQEFKSKKNLFLDDSGGEQNVTAFATDGKESFIPLEQISLQNRNLLISHYHALFKSSVRAIPSLVFAGESRGRFFVKFFNRPLTPTDFVSLWNAGMGESSGVNDSIRR